MVFFFQAEDGIRDYKVTGVQTCALPISNCVITKPLRNKKTTNTMFLPENYDYFEQAGMSYNTVRVNASWRLSKAWLRRQEKKLTKNNTTRCQEIPSAKINS